MDNYGEFLTASSLRSQRHHMNHNALNDQQIDSLIADALGITHPHFSPCNNINDAWPIIEKYNLALIPGHGKSRLDSDRLSRHSQQNQTND